MPVNKSLAKSLKKTYGKRGESVYYAMENAGKPAFKKGMKKATKEGHTAKSMKAMKTKKRTGKGEDTAAEERREAKMSPAALKKHEASEKKEMGAKKYAAHEASEKKEMGAKPKRKPVTKKK